MITIREVVVEDAAAIRMLSHQLGYSISEQQTMENINAIKDSKHHEAFVAMNGQQVVGWTGLSYNISLESPPLCEVRGLVVHEKFRGRGIGKMLIEKAREWSINNGTSKLRLRCNTKRTELFCFTRTLGLLK